MLSVVIPTSGPRDILPTLESLSDQLDPDFELLVVENGPPSESLLEALRNFSGGLNLTHLSLPEAGLNRARNFAVQHAQHDLIALIDDDCVAVPGWTVAIKHNHARYPEAGVIGGRVLLEMASGVEPVWLRGEFRRSLAEIDWGETTGPLQRWQHLVGANLSFRRDIFDRVGGFREDIGLRGGDRIIRANDEAEFIQHAAIVGEPGVVYASDMAVQHRIPADRLSFDYMLRRRFGQGVSDIEQELATLGMDAALWRFAGMLNQGQWHHTENIDISRSLQREERPRYLLQTLLARFCYLAGARYRLTESEPAFPGSRPEVAAGTKAYERGGAIASQLSNASDEYLGEIVSRCLYRDWGRINPLRAFSFISGLLSPMMEKESWRDRVSG